MNRITKMMFAAVVAFTISIGSAHAALITSVDRASFQTAVAGGAILGQDFDGLTAGTLLGTLGGVTYSASGGTPIVTNSFLTSTNPNGLGSTSIGFFQATETATFSFASAITAFAIDINTFATTDGAYQGVLSIGDIATSIFEVFPSTATGQFLGFVSDTAFNSITLSATTNFTYTLDTLAYGDAADLAVVPVPAAVWLFGTALIGFVGMSRRRKVA